MKFRFASYFTLFALLLVSSALFAQDTAQITGTVTDSSGAAVPNAQVNVDSVERGVHRTSVTNGNGEYTFSALPVGTVDLSVTAAGFKKYQAKGVILSVGQKARNDISLEVGSVGTEVTVEGASVAQVETQSSDLSGVVNGKEISQLELNGRNFSQLITLVPGVTNQSGQDEAQVGVNGNVAFSVNGGRTEYNNWELDGGELLDNGSNTSLNVYPSIDAIGEFRVLTSNYGAQYGRSGSGTVEVETKSGTSSFHGNLYEFNRNTAYNAYGYFDDKTKPKPDYKKNDFGYTIGGPVFIPKIYNAAKQKTFFFWSQEWRRDNVPNPFGLVNVPSVAERGGDFSDLCPGNDCPAQPQTLPDGSPNPQAGAAYPGNKIPLSTDPADPNFVTVQALENLIPAPNVGTNQWQLSPTLPIRWREELLRLDHNVNDKIRVNFHYIHDSWNEIYPTPLWTSGTSFPTVQTNFVGPGISLLARLTISVTPTLLNEFVAAYTTDHISTHLVGAWQRPANFLPITVFDPASHDFQGKVPGISLNGGLYSGINEDPGYVPNGPLNSNPTYSYKDNVTKLLGSHNLQFGAYFAAVQKNEIPQPGVGVNGILGFDTGNAQVTTGNAFADLLLGNPSTFQQEKAATKTYNRYKIFEPYFQDDWHASKRLTLNLGLRVSMYGTYREIHHSAWNFDPGHYVPGDSSIDPADGNVIGNPFNGWVQCGVTAGVPVGCLKGHLFNPAPRLGFAFDPFADGKWALRGGYGIFFEHTNQGEANAGTLEQYNPQSQTPNVSLTTTTGYANITPALLGTTTAPLGFVSIPNKVIWPRIQQWHLDLQHDIGKNTVATISYVGSAGSHLTRQFELNQVRPVPLTQNPYQPGEAESAADCDPTGTGAFDAYGVPMNASTPSGNPIAYNPPSTPGGLPSGPAVNLAIATGCGGTFADAFRPFPGIGSITRKEPTAASNYNALEASLRHTIGGLELNFSYTYSHSIDDASDWSDAGLLNAYNLEAFRANSNFDQRHVIEFSYVYDLPVFKNKNLSGKLLGGWELSGITSIQSGSPFSVYNAGNSIVPGDNAGVANGVASSGASYPDKVGNPKSSIQQVPVAGFGPFRFNPSAFVAPRGLTFGDSGRNSLSNPFRTNFDMALLKHFALTESKYFEFRAEAFNVFNHTQFLPLGGDAGSAAANQSSGTNSIGCYGGSNNTAGDPSCTGGLTQAAFLHANAVHNARILQLALKFIF